MANLAAEPRNKELLDITEDCLIPPPALLPSNFYPLKLYSVSLPHNALIWFKRQNGDEMTQADHHEELAELFNLRKRSHLHL
jgi:hypothetical protein